MDLQARSVSFSKDFNMLEELQKRSSVASNAGTTAPKASSKPPASYAAPSKAELAEKRAEVQKQGLTGKDYWNSVPELRAISEKAESEQLPPEPGWPIDVELLMGTLGATREMHHKSAAMARVTPNPNALQVEVTVPRIFSSAKIEGLTRISISDMMIRKTHKSKYLLCKTKCKPLYDIASGIFIVIEDPEGNIGYLKLFNYATLIDVTAEERDSVLYIGRVLAIREPTYSSNTTVPKLPFVKVDTPSDVVFVDEDHPYRHDVLWHTDMDVPGLPLTGEAWRASALQSFKTKRWFSCVIGFSDCIKLGYDIQLSRLNRSEAYLRLGWYNSAFHDSKNALDSGTLTEDLKKKAVVRMLKAKYGLWQYNAVLETARELPNDASVLEWSEKASKRLEEQTSGNFDWTTLFKENQTPLFTVDRADFTGPIEVKRGSNGVRGTFVTSDVKAGELLLFHKPICNWTPNDNATQILNFNIRQCSAPTFTVREGRNAYLFFTKTVQSVWDNRNLYQTILSLQGGEHLRSPNPYPPPLVTEDPPLEHPTKPVVDIDIEYVEGVLYTNSFAHSGSLQGRGLYALPSLINHSCLPSAHKTFMGSAIVVRACRDMKKGEELTVEYIDGNVPYDERQFRLQHSWRFKCVCQLCEADGAEDPKARERRKELAKLLSKVMEVLVTPQGMDKTNLKRVVAEAKKNYEDMKKTYSDSYASLTGGVKFELAEATRHYAAVVERLGRVASDSSMMKLTVELRMDCLELSGIKVLDRSMSGPIRKDVASLPIDTSRFPPAANQEFILMMLQIVQSFEEFKDKKRAQRWWNATLYVGKMYNGGGKEVFKILYTKYLGPTGNAGRINSLTDEDSTKLVPPLD